jgi:Macrocin-O-methyltransferase (TylF)
VHEVDRENVHVKTGVWGAGVYKGLDPVQLRHVCQKYLPADAVKTHAGWFSESLPKLDPGTKFALIHIDCDLYQSALEVLDFVFKNSTLSDGALVLFDDWNCCRASKDFGERKAWREACDRYQVVAEDAGGYGWAGHRFIVHSYSH